MGKKVSFMLLTSTALVLQGALPGFCADADGNGSTGGTPPLNFHIGGSVSPAISTTSSSNSEASSSRSSLAQTQNLSYAPPAGLNLVGRLQQIRAANAPDSSLDDSSLQPASDGSQRSLGNAGATSEVNSQSGSGFPGHSQAFASTLNRSTSDPGPVSFDLNASPPTELTRSYQNFAVNRDFLNSSNARALKEALEQRNRELGVPSVDGSGRQQPSGFSQEPSGLTSWNTDWDTSSYYSRDPQDAANFPPPPSSWVEQVNSDFASRRDAYSSTPEKPPVPQKLNLSQNNTSNATTTAPVAAAANPGRKPPVPPKPNFSQNNSNVPTPAAPAVAAPVIPPAAAPAPVIPPAPPLPAAAAAAPVVPPAAAPAQQQRPSKLSSALKGINGGVFAGYGKQWNRFYLGLEATYLLSNEKANLDNLTFRKKNTAEIAIRPGFVVGHALFYGKIGFLSSQFKLADKPFRFNGMSLGCGADMKLSPKTLLGLGYTCEMYGKKKYIDQNNASLNLKPTSHRVMLRIGHRF